MRDDALGCPADVLDLLPWYPDDGLTGEERGMVEAHAAVCPACRGEVLDGFRNARLPEGAPSAEHVLARVFARIAAGDAAPTTPAVSALGIPTPPEATMLRSAPTLARATPRRRSGDRRAFIPAWAAAAGIALAVGALGAAAVLRLTAAPAPVYQTAAAPPLPGTPDAQIDVILRDDVSAAQLRSALQAVGAEIVAGPTVLGRYQLRLRADTGGRDASAAASALRAEGTGIATFAEPTSR